ncbi:MAG: hypothetical protein IJ614_08615 [Prevotella sp.]|nr:hypothetical protein [Prevotella sp.]MBR1506154.1 hypothetical protein [Prevotella sp.]
MYMQGTAEELDIITRIRGEVASRKDITGENLFLAWGYPTVIVLLIEFAALILWNEDWCAWLWAGIPLIGTPLMIYFLNEDYERTRHRTLDQNVILMMWVFIGFASCVGGAAMGFAGVFQYSFFAYLSLLCGMGCFMTGVILHFRPKTICGIIASLLSAVPLFFQGEQWPWQLLVTAASVAISLIIPGHLFKKYVQRYYNS